MSLRYTTCSVTNTDARDRRQGGDSRTHGRLIARGARQFTHTPINRLILPDALLRAMCVMVVEDDALLAMDLSTTLCEHGYQLVGPFASIAPAIDAVKHASPTRLFSIWT